MPDNYNLGRAHGSIEIDYEGSGAEDAREDIEEIGEEAEKSQKRTQKATEEQNKDYEALAEAAKKAAASLDFNPASTEQMAATVKALEKDVTDASTAAQVARQKLTGAEEQLAAARTRAGATAKEVADAERAVRSAQQQVINSTNRLDTNTRALATARQQLNRIPQPPDPVPDDDGGFRTLLQHLQQIQRNTDRSSSLLNTFSGRIKLMAAGIAIATPQVAGLGVALASLAGLAGVAAGALAALGATAGTLVAGMSGIGEAFKAAGAEAKAAGASAGSSASAQRSAARAIEDAQRGVAEAQENLKRTYEDTTKAMAQALRAVLDAQRDLQEAQRDALRAQESLNRARQQALRDLEDMQAALTGGGLDERQAILDVKKAQEELNKVLKDPTATADDIEQATVNLEKQKLALEQTRKENERLKTDASAAAAAGVEGSDAVVSAQDGVRNAVQGVADAQRSLADAQENVRQTQVDSQRQIADAVQAVIDAQRNLADAYASAAEAGGAAAGKLNDALANLSPNARAFVEEVIGLRSAWEAVRKSVQDNLFEGLAQEVEPLARQWFPLLEQGMGGVATALNGIVKETISYLKTAEAQQNVANIFENTGEALSNMRFIVQDLLAAFLDIASVGSDFLPDLASGAANAAAQFREFINAAKESGQLRQWMQEALDTASELWQLLKNLGSIIASVFTGLDQSGGGALTTLTALTGEISEFLKSAEGQEALQSLGHILQSIGSAYGKVFITFLEVVADLLISLEPLITSFADAAGTYLAGALEVLKPTLKLIADLFGYLGPALGPVIAGIYAANKAVGAAKVVWAALNTTMGLNPFIAIAGAIIALVIIIIQNWDSISAYLAGIWEDISSQATAIWTAIRDFFVGIWNDITSQFNAAITAIRDFFVGIATDIKNQWNSFWSGLRDFFVNIGSTIKNQIGTFVENVVNFFKELPGKVWNFIKGLPGQFLQLGKDIVSGILRGLGGLASALWNKLKQAVSDAWDSVLDFFGINSPSKLAAEAGEFIVMGLVQGIDRHADAAVQAASAMAAAVGEELTGATGTLATTIKMASDTSGIPKQFPASSAVNSLVSVASTRGGDGASVAGAGGRTIIIENLTVQVAGNLDPTNPVAFRRTMVRIKDELRGLDGEYK